MSEKWLPFRPLVGARKLTRQRIRQVITPAEWRRRRGLPKRTDRKDFKPHLIQPINEEDFRDLRL